MKDELNKKATSTVDQYISDQPEPIRKKLELLRQTIRKVAPDAQEVISYQMPAYKFHGMLAHFAAHTNHYGMYVAPKVLDSFRDKLTNYKLAKATIQFTFNEPFPEQLVADIIAHAMKVNLDNKAKKELAKAEKKKKK